MPPKDLTTEILKDIRDELRQTRTELKGELVETNTRLDHLSRRVVEGELRTATAITDLHGTLREVVDLFRAEHPLAPRVERCEKDISELKQRLGGR